MWQIVNIRETPVAVPEPARVGIYARRVLCLGDFDALPACIRSAVGDADDVIAFEPAVCMWLQLTRQFDLVVIDSRNVAMTTPEARRAVVHAAVQHLSPGGRLVASFAPNDPCAASYEQMCAEFELEPDDRENDTGDCIAHRRTRRSTIHDLVFDARSRIARIDSAALCAALESERPPTVVDTRTGTDRERFGVIRGSIHIPRTTLEWASDPSNGYRHPTLRTHDQPLVIVCNAGYSSSLAAANLALIGFSSVCDLVGGHHAWVRAGHEVVPPDHTTFDW